MTPIKTRTASHAEQLLAKLQLRTATVAIVGLGYVGLPLAETFAWGGFNVVGFDIDETKIDRLNAGQSYIKHISSQRVQEMREA
jgi:UDP-N-acetyl-D-glucosamine dehydrogenase